MSDILGGLLIPFVIIFIAVAFVVVIKVIASRYKKIPPGKAGIFYGRSYTTEDPRKQGEKVSLGFKVVPGGGRVVMPFVESYSEMDTGIFQVEIDETGIPNMDNVQVNVKGVATCKISTIPEDLMNAAQNFLGKTEQEIHEYVRNILRGHLRTIIGKMDINKLLRERDEFNKQVMNESGNELKSLGIEIKTLVIQDIKDEYGYIDALGKRAVAEAKRDADIKIAEADRETKIKVSNATRDAATVAADNDAQIAKAEMERDLKRADFKTKADTEKAKADTAHQIALAAQEQVLKVAQAKRDAAEREAQIEVEKKEAERMQAHLEATVVRQAEADKKKIGIDAEAAKMKKVTEATAEAEALKTKAEAERDYAVKIGEGNAAKEKAILVARAEGAAAEVREKLLAEAAGKVADAEATEKLAEALKKLDQRGQLILILNALPQLIEKGGDAGEKMLTAIFKNAAAPLGNIDSLNILDMGGKGNGVNAVSSVVPELITKVFASMKTLGWDPTRLFEKLGIDSGEIGKILGPVVGSTDNHGEAGGGGRKKAAVEA